MSLRTPDAALAEFVERSRRELGAGVCVATMWATLAALDLSL